MAKPTWLESFETLVPPGPQSTAAKALLPLARPSEITSPLTARRHVSAWERRWLEVDAQRQPLTARSYASRLRVALTEFAEEVE